MTEQPPRGVAALPTPLKILLIISLALLPIGMGAAMLTYRNLEAANVALDKQARDKAQVTIETLRLMIARNALGTRVAANAALATRRSHPCQDVQRSLEGTPAEARHFALLDEKGNVLCTIGMPVVPTPRPRFKSGDMAFWISESEDALFIGSAGADGAVIVGLDRSQLTSALDATPRKADQIILLVGQRQLQVRRGTAAPPPDEALFTLPVHMSGLSARITVVKPPIDTGTRLLIFLPLIMWAAAALISWAMVHRLLIRPLRKLQAAVSAYEPGDNVETVVPPGLGPAREIHELGEAFQRAVARVEGAELEALAALEGQRRLVREVHHRVKNNLQVVASLLSIHGRDAGDEAAQRAYVAIGRRVDALSVVHRNHFAEMEESRGIALRPLVTELAAGLRASAPSEARATQFDLEIDGASTTQDVAVAIAFLITEIVEFSLLRTPGESIRITIRRTSELTAKLAMESAALIPPGQDDGVANTQFERIVEGLARQLRSPLDRRLGRYSVMLPIFPEG